jgi:opacity protein-like surface antigen
MGVLEIMKPLLLLRLPALAVLVILGVGSAQAQRYEFQPFAGYQTPGSFDITATRQDQLRFKDGPSYGFTFGYRFTPNFQFEFLWDRNDTNVSQRDRTTGSLTKLFRAALYQYQFDALYEFRSEEARVRPFIVGGLGFAHLDPHGNFDGFTKFSYNLGGGVKYMPDRHVGLRFDARWMPIQVRSDNQLFCNPFGICFVAPQPVYLHRGNFTGGIIFRF